MGQKYFINFSLSFRFYLEQPLIMRCSIEHVVVESSAAVLDERVDHENQNYLTLLLIFDWMREFKEEIEQKSVQWNNIAYRLSMNTGKSSIKIIKLFKYPRASSHLRNQNQKVESLVDITDYKTQYKSKILNQTIPLEDVLFFCGHVNIKKYHAQPNKIFHFLVCSVSLGKIGKFDDKKQKINSIFVPSESSNQPYHFNFILNNHSQYQVKYQVSFVISDELQFRNNDVICSICEHNLAEAYCRDEKMYFCDDCCRTHHHDLKTAYEDENRKKAGKQTASSAYKKNNQANMFPPFVPHQLQSLNRINVLPLCEIHNSKNQYFCLKCEKYLCNVCRQKGSHNQNSEHLVKPVEYLYEQKNEMNALISSSSKQKIEGVLDEIEQISRAITQNYENVRKNIIAQFETALKRLQDLYFEKISKVYSNQIELNMLYQKLQWSKAFITHQQKYLKPIYYFKLQSRFIDQIERIKISGFQQSLNTKADLDYYADVRVGTKSDESILRGKQLKQTNQKYPQALSGKETQSYHNEVELKVNKSLLKFDSRSEAPRKGELCSILEKTNLHIFKYQPTTRYTPRI